MGGDTITVGLSLTGMRQYDGDQRSRGRTARTGSTRAARSARRCRSPASRRRRRSQALSGSVMTLEAAALGMPATGVAIDDRPRRQPRRAELAAGRLRRHVAGRRLVRGQPGRHPRLRVRAEAVRPVHQDPRLRQRGRRVGLPARQPVRVRRPRRDRRARACSPGITCNATTCDLPSVGFTAYGGVGNDLIIGSQTGDHLAGGSGDDEIRGLRGADHIYGDSGVNVNILTRAPHDRHRQRQPGPDGDEGRLPEQRHDDRARPVARRRQHGRRP